HVRRHLADATQGLADAQADERAPSAELRIRLAASRGQSGAHPIVSEAVMAPDFTSCAIEALRSLEQDGRRSQRTRSANRIHAIGSRREPGRKIGRAHV